MDYASVDDRNWPPYLSVHRPLGIIICHTHGCAYAQNNIDLHLKREHNVAKTTRTAILAAAKSTVTIAHCLKAVKKPDDGQIYIRGLPILTGYRCDHFELDGCSFRSVHEEVWKQHRRATHGTKGDKDQSKLAEDARVHLQSLSSARQQRDYFVVRMSDVVPGRPRNDSDWKSGMSDLQQRFEQTLLASQQNKYDVIDKLQHVSELTTWLRETGFQAHLEGLQSEDLPKLYAVPTRESSDPLLWTICAGIDRVLRRGMALLDYDKLDQEQLGRLDAKLINTFQPGSMSQDPIKPLQNARSKHSYIHIFKQLACYFARVVEQQQAEGEDARESRFFRSTVDQGMAWANVGREAGYLCSRSEDASEDMLDDTILTFLVSLIEQKVPGRKFDSAILSFIAVLSWHHRTKTWVAIGNYTSYLSRIVYGCQVIAILYSRGASKRDSDNDFTDYLVDFRDRWLLSNTRGPVADILSWRLLGEGTSSHTVPEALLRWSDDGEEVTYRAIRLSMHDIQTLLQHELRAATEIFRRDLCLGLEDRPEPAVRQFCDNWDDRRPGASFLTDARNADTVRQCQSWINDSLLSSPDLVESFYERDGSGQWHVQAHAVRQYENAVQSFLERMMVLIHIGSGQPARRPEFVGLRWCNRQADRRNLYLHDGKVVFILTYHKSLNLTHASRFPVRMLAPAVAELLVQYLLLVIPFRTWLTAECSGSSAVSEYLWAKDGQVWTENRMSDVLESESQAVIGKRVTVQAWRQIAVSIAMKKLDRAGCATEDLLGQGDGADDDEALEKEAMPEALHWQASHTPRIGNMAYGNTINFNAGLTDAGLHEYIRVSQLWQRLLRIDGASVKRKRILSVDSDEEYMQTSLPKRLAALAPTRMCRRHWSMEEVRTALQHVYGPKASYKTAEQERAVQAITAGLTPVVVVMGTGSGKSLLYMLLQRLPGAGTTILVVPLTALKQDTMRRCQRMGVECRVWDDDASHTGVGNSLVIVSLDRAVRSPRFRAYLRTLEMAGQLGSIVIDESHLILTAAGYRESMQQAKELRGHRCQQIYLSATLPPCMYNAFTEQLLLPAAVQIRCATVRQDIKYTVQTMATPVDFMLNVVSKIRREMMVDSIARDVDARVIVYCRRKTETEAFAEQLLCPFYHSTSGTEEEKLAVLMSWREGRDSKVIVATSAFGPGIDYGSVRLVVHVGPPRSAIDFAQEVGRAGRDGQGGTSIVYLHEDWRAQTRGRSGELLDLDRQTMHRYLDFPRCRKAVIGSFLDGGRSARCEADTAQCDRCRDEARYFKNHPFSDDASESSVDDDSRSNTIEQAGGLGECIGRGVELLEADVKEQEQRRRTFIQQLEAARELCMICLVMDGNGKAAHHVLGNCERNEKWKFFEAKKELKDAPGGWMDRYSGCYRCGVSQTICGEQAGEQCRYRDTVMPLCWAGYAVSNEWRPRLANIWGHSELDSTYDFMRWLGKGRRVFGEQSSGLVMIGSLMLDAVIKY